MAFGLDHVNVRLGGAIALRGVTLEIPASTVTAIVGGDGAGKTTAMRALVGTVRVAAGAVRRPPRREIGYLPATAGAYMDLTVEENVSFVGAAFGLRGRELDARAGPLLEGTGLNGIGGRLAAQLSGGMQRKLALVLVLLHDPRLLVLDEPTTGVDPVSRAQLWRLIAAAAAGGAAVVLTTTYLEEAERAARVLVLDGGTELAAGTPGAVIAALPGRVGSAQRAPQGGVCCWRRGAAWRVWSADGPLPEGATLIEPDLEDAVTVAALRAEQAVGP